MRKRLMILGASRYLCRSIQAARSIGCEVVVTDRDTRAPGFAFADHFEPVDISDPVGTLEVARQYRIDGLLALNDFGVPTAAIVAEQLGLPALTPDVAVRATNKLEMRRCWGAAGIPTVKHCVVRTVEEAQLVLPEFGGLPVVFKPADSRGGGSRGVSLVERDDQIEPAFTFAQSFYDNPDVLVEEYLQGSEHSIEAIAYEGEVYVVAIGDNTKLPPPYRVNKRISYPTVLREKDREALTKACQTAVQALGIDSGVAHVEVCMTAAGPRLFELGARCGGGGIPDPIVPYVTGINLVQEAARQALGEKPQCLRPFLDRSCVYQWFTLEPGVVRRIDGLGKVSSWKGILDCALFVEPGAKIGPIRVGSDRAGFFIAAGKTHKIAHRLADKAERAVVFQYD